MYLLQLKVNRLELKIQHAHSCKLHICSKENNLLHAGQEIILKPSCTLGMQCSFFC